MTIAIGANDAFKKQAEALMRQAVEQFQATGEKARLHARFAHRAQTDTLQVKLFKASALIKQSTPRLWLHLASGWPCQELPRSALEDVAPLPAPT